MPPEPIEAGSPADWLRYARSDLNLARVIPQQGIMLEMLCFHAQQAAEKSIKAVLLQAGVPFPRTHNIGTLLELLPASYAPPHAVVLATSLTDYAVVNRYPGEYEEASDVDYEEAYDSRVSSLPGPRELYTNGLDRSFRSNPVFRLPELWVTPIRSRAQKPMAVETMPGALRVIIPSPCDVTPRPGETVAGTAS